MDNNYCILGEGYCKWCRHCIVKYVNVEMMSEKRYRCPKCKSPLVFHHETKEIITFECKKCNHLVMARKG